MAANLASLPRAFQRLIALASQGHSLTSHQTQVLQGLVIDHREAIVACSGLTAGGLDEFTAKDCSPSRQLVTLVSNAAFTALTVHLAQAPNFSARTMKDLLEEPAQMWCNLPVYWTGEKDPSKRKRVVTVLFADIKGFSTFAEECSSDDRVGHLMQDLLATFSNFVTAKGGLFRKTTGDACLAFFARGREENHAMDAIEVGLQLVEAAGLWREKQKKDPLNTGVPLHHIGNARVGIHTGEAVFLYIEESKKWALSAYGSHVNQAARIEPLAYDPIVDATGAPDKRCRVGISEATRNFVGDCIRVTDKGEKTVKGLRHPIHIFFVDGVDKTRLAAAAVHRMGTDFVGRTKELGLIQEAYEEVRSGKGARFVLLDGEAGMGKTHLANEGLEKIDPNRERLFLKGEDRESLTPYASLGHGLAHFFGIDARTDPPAALAQMAIKVFPSNNISDIDQAALTDLSLFLRFTLHPDDSKLKVQLEGPDVWERIQKAVVHVLIAYSKRLTLVIQADDMQWMDEGSRKLLDALYEEGFKERIFGLGTTRPKLKRSPYFLPIEVKPLDAQDLEQIVNRMLPEETRREMEPKALLSNILKLSNNITYLIIDICSSLASGWKIVEDEEVKDKKDKQLHLIDPMGKRRPVSQGFLQAKIDLLDDRGGEALRLASILGPSFSEKDMQGLARFLEGADSGAKWLDFEIKEELVSNPQRILMELVTGGYLIPPAADSDNYEWPHALLRETAYEQNVDAKKVALHGLVADYLGDSSRKEGRVVPHAQIAFHYERASKRPEAMEAYRLAGEANIKSAPDLSLSYFRRACECAYTSDGKVLLVKPTDLNRVLRGMSVAIQVGRRYGWHEEMVYKPGLRIIEQLPTIDQRGHHLRQARIFTRLGRCGEAVVILQQVLAILEKEMRNGMGEDDLQEAWQMKSTLHQELGFALGEGGRFKEAKEHYEQAKQAALEAKAQTTQGGGRQPSEKVLRSIAVVEGRALWGMNHILEEIGDHRDLESRHQNTVRHFEELGDTRRVGGCLEEWGGALRAAGNFEGAKAKLKEALDLRETSKNKDIDVGEIHSTLGRTLCLQGEVDEGIRILEENGDNPDQDGWSSHLIYLADAYLVKDRVDEARAKAKEALQLAEKGPITSNVAMAKSLLSRVDKENAIRLSQEAVDLVAQGLVSAEFDVSILFNRANLQRNAGQLDEAWAAINEARHKILSRAETIDEDQDKIRYVNLIPLHQKVMGLWHEIKPGR